METTLEKLFYYNVESPSFLSAKEDRFVGNNNVIVSNLKNESVGCIGGGGYYVVGANKLLMMVHRVIWELHYGKIPDGTQIDGNRANNDINNLRAVDVATNRRNCALNKNNRSGVKGVHLTSCTASNGIVYDYWCASWYCHTTGRQQRKTFSVTKLGNEEAFKQATAARQAATIGMNLQGAGYTERHIK